MRKIVNVMEICSKCAAEYGGIGCQSRLAMASSSITEEEAKYHRRVAEVQMRQCPLEK